MPLTSFQQGWLDRGKELNAIYDALTSVFGRSTTHDPVADILTLGAERDRYREALQHILDHGQTHDEPCWALHNGDCADVFQEIARVALAETAPTSRTEAP